MRADVSGLKKLAKKITGMPRRTQEEMDSATVRFGVALHDATRRHASGRPGPNVITGAYRESIALEYRDGGAFVFSGAPQAHRLEYGFVGLDSMGRMYHQPPYPHFRTALAEIRPLYLKEIRMAPLKAWRSM
jgi:hypothetical protein